MPRIAGARGTLVPCVKAAAYATGVLSHFGQLPSCVSNYLFFVMFTGPQMETQDAALAAMESLDDQHVFDVSMWRGLQGLQ